jgi:ketosteroid isomerase-like protein
MRTPAAVLAPSIMFLGLACAPAEQAPPPAEPELTQAEATQLFNDLVEAFDAAVNAEDADAFLELFGDAPASMPPNVPLREGAEMIRGWQTDFFDLGDVEVDNVLEGVRVSGDLAVGWGRFASSITPEEGEALSNVGKWMAIWERQSDGSWLILRNIWNSDQPLDM